MTDLLARRNWALTTAVDLGKRLGMMCDKARVIKDSNNTIVHLAPTPLIAKVGTTTIRPDAASALESELRRGTHLAKRGAPIAPPAGDVLPGPHFQTGAVITLWEYIEPRSGASITDAALGEMLTRFHRAFTDYRGDLPDFTENLSRARGVLQDPAMTPALADPDRFFLLQVEAEIRDALKHHELERHPLHGDPHLDGNILQSDRGPLLIDFEAACIGPYEWDLTSLERARVAYPDAEGMVLELLSRMRSLSVSTWCWMQYGRAPEVDEAAHVHLELLRDKPPDDGEGNPRDANL